jgi:sugar fermentation stimulation protein A
MEEIYRPFGTTRPARFVARPNRFLVQCECEGTMVEAFLPNPGRLQELLLPDSLLYLATGEASETRRTEYTVVGVRRDGHPVMLHTHETNTAVGRLLERRLIPGFERTNVVRREVTVGHSRFDFLLQDGDGEIFLEVKSCTLFGQRIAMFPDAVTARGARHLRELAELSKKGVRSAVLFAVQWPKAEFFMPDYHTDLFFARTLLQVRHEVRICPVALHWRDDLSLSGDVASLVIPWGIVEREAHDSGGYILILELDQDRTLSFGKDSTAFFKKGFYLYVGSAMANLTARIARHLRLRKQFHWHIDWLRANTKVVAALPIRSADRLECGIARDLAQISDWSIDRFGASDCSCSTHLFGMGEHPLQRPAFHRFLQYYRMDRMADEAATSNSGKG